MDNGTLPRRLQQNATQRKSRRTTLTLTTIPCTGTRWSTVRSSFTADSMKRCCRDLKLFWPLMRYRGNHFDDTPLRVWEGSVYGQWICPWLFRRENVPGAIAQEVLFFFSRLPRQDRSPTTRKIKTLSIDLLGPSHDCKLHCPTPSFVHRGTFEASYTLAYHTAARDCRLITHWRHLMGGALATPVHFFSAHHSVIIFFL